MHSQTNTHMLQKKQEPTVPSTYQIIIDLMENFAPFSGLDASRYNPASME
jgi:hypothetical protein